MSSRRCDRKGGRTETVVDFANTTYRTPHYPSEDEKLRASTLSRRRGGNCANSLEVLQQLLEHSDIKNLKTASPNINLVAVLPARSSVATHQIRAGLEPHVSLEHSIFRELFNEPASSYIIKASDSGSRTIVNYNELPEMTVEEFQVIADSLGPGANWFHFEVGLWHISFSLSLGLQILIVGVFSRVGYLISSWIV